MIVEQKNSSKQNKIRQLKKAIKSMYTFERVKNFKCLGVILNEDKSPNTFTRKNKKCQQNILYA